MKRIQVVGMVLLLLLFSVGCSKPQLEEQAVELEPEEAITVAEDGNAKESVEESGEEDLEEVDEVDQNKFPEFALKNLKDEEVTEAIFNDHDLVLVNIWGTTCAPCIREMPELEKLEKNYSEKGLKVLGIVSDGNYLAAKEITDALLLTYEHIVADEDFAYGYLSKFQFVPTTLFVNNEGVILGEPMVGAYDYETFEEKVIEYLEINE